MTAWIDRLADRLAFRRQKGGGWSSAEMGAFIDIDSGVQDCDGDDRGGGGGGGGGAGR